MRALVPALLALALTAPVAAAQTCGSTAGVPSFSAGAQPASDDQVSTYLSAVGAASSRVITRDAGTSVQGRPLPYALVSSPHNLARLSAIAARARASRTGHGFAAGGPAIVWLAASVHGNEPSGTDADLQVLSELAHASSCALLDRLVVGILPVQNPDGRAAGTQRVRPQSRLVRRHPARDDREAAAARALPAGGLRRPARGGRHRVLLPAEHQPDPPRDPARGAARDRANDRAVAGEGVP
jgi:murein tripeptide amidase MpaA